MYKGPEVLFCHIWATLFHRYCSSLAFLKLAAMFLVQAPNSLLLVTTLYTLLLQTLSAGCWPTFEMC